MNDFKYRPDIDGLRAVAVVVVLFFHAGLGLRGGFIGVDVFFVVSGFLITRLILKEQAGGSFRITQFWMRRIRRIVPAALFVTLTTMLVGSVVLFPIDYVSLAHSAIAQQFMLSNVYFYRNTGYFSGLAELQPLLHTWSLAVEEQFYLVYPLILMFLGRFSKRIVVSGLAALAVGSFLLNLREVRVDPTAAFFLLPGRAWELLIGGLLCFVPVPTKADRRIVETVGWLGIAGILFAAWFYDPATPFPDFAALVPCLGTAMVVWANSVQATSLGKVLSSRPLVCVGLISYSLYLWHWPLLSFARYMNAGALPTLPVRLAAFAASFVLAAFSLRFIESPIRTRGVLAGTKGLLFASSAGVLLVLAASLLIEAVGGLPDRFDRRAVAHAAGRASRLFRHEVTTKMVKEGELPTFGATGGARTCLVWGDSHAMALVPGIDAACKVCDVRGFQVTQSSSPPLSDPSEKPESGGAPNGKFNRAVLDLAISQKFDVVILGGFWSRYAKQPNFESGLIQTVEELLAAGVRVAFVGGVAEQQGYMPLVLSMAVRFDRDGSKIGVPLQQYREDQQAYSGVIERLRGKGLLVLDPAPYFVDDSGLWRAEYDGKAMYWDAHHLTVEGSLRLQPLFEQLFDDLKKK